MKSRKRLTQAQWKAHIEAWQQSGGTQADYCRKHGLTDKVFSLWKRRFQRENVIDASDPTRSKPKATDFVPIKVVSQSPSQDQILLRLPNGIELQLSVANFNSLNANVVSDLCQIR